MNVRRPISVLSLALALLVPTLSAASAAAQPGAPRPAHQEKAVLAGGCFWGMEAVFERLRGVSTVVAGFAGGTKATAHYETVSTGRTGHAESVEITFDPSVISYRQLLDVYFTVAHDPTQLDRQGPDDGPQYRSAIFYENDGQKRAADQAIRELTAAHRFASPIVTKVVAYTGFYPAEAYHQHFADRNPDYPYIVINDAPKVKDLAQRFPALLNRTYVAAK